MTCLTKIKIGPGRLVATSLLLAGLLLCGCEFGRELPEPGSDDYMKVVSLHHSAVARLQVGDEVGAGERFRRMVSIAPGEPSASYNLGLMALRRNEADRAARHLARARESLPDDPQILLLSGFLERRRDRPGEAAAYFRRVVALDSTNLFGFYALAQEVERRGGVEGLTEAGRLIERILKIRPQNLPARLGRARLAMAAKDGDKLEEALDHLRQHTSSWDTATQGELDKLYELIRASNYARAQTQLRRLENMLKRTRDYQVGQAELAFPEEVIAGVMTRLQRLPMPDYRPAAADTSLAFSVEGLSEGSARWDWAGIFYPNPDEPPVAIAANRRRVGVGSGRFIAFPGGGGEPEFLRSHPVAALDYDYDFRMDLALAGAGGFRLFRQTEDGGFEDATSSTMSRLPAGMTDRAYTGVWAVDLDAEGDMDLILGSESGTVVLRNNGDGTFAGLPLFEEITGLRQLAWVDIDNDGDSDPTFLLDSGLVRGYRNERSGKFVPESGIDRLGKVLSMAVADLDQDGTFELIALQEDGTVTTAAAAETEAVWTTEEVADATALMPGTLDPEKARLVVADLDNNGGLDVLVSVRAGAGIWQRQSDGSFQRFVPILDLGVFGAADFTEDGLLDLVAITDAGDLALMPNLASDGYYFAAVRPRSIKATGDRRINPFGIGGEIEVRSGSVFQKQPIDRPVVHFGLGARAVVDAARIIWPNGDTQAEFDFQADTTIQVYQRLKGSCPWVFAFDGREMTFVTDFLWRSPLGLKINAVETAGIATTEDWVKIEADQLAERDGKYEIRITAELWETHFFDHVSLIAVDHPAGSEIFVDERFAFPPPELKIYETGALQPVRGAWDHRARDVSDIVRAVDDRYLAGFKVAGYQGRAEDHFVELDLGSLSRSGRTWLVASGWVYPTDSSINVALGQGDYPSPQGVRLEIMRPDGTWNAVGSDLGFPAGKKKTVLIDLTGLFAENAPARLRLRTNLEIYWDAISWAQGLSEAKRERIEHRIGASTAELRYRGFSRIERPGRPRPEVPIYEELGSTQQMWRDLVGYYTRYGDVTELLKQVDDRYVIMNAGDEMRLTFESPGTPPSGYERDFVLVGDGWVKDGDYNTSFSKTVRPLPDHSNADYTGPSGRLGEDPVYQLHPGDWDTFHTRYVRPDRFTKATWPAGTRDSE